MSLVKNGLGFNRRFLKNKGEDFKNSKAQRKLVVVFGISLDWIVSEVREDVMVLVDDSHNFEVPWLPCDIRFIFHAMEYFFEYDVKILFLLWLNLKYILKIEDMEDSWRLKIVAHGLNDFLLVSYFWFRSIPLNWIWT